MHFEGINPFQRLQFTSDDQGLLYGACHLPLDILAYLSTPFVAEDSDRVELKKLCGEKLSDKDSAFVIGILTSSKYPSLRKEMTALFASLKPEEVETLIQKGLEKALDKDGCKIPVERFFDLPWQELLKNESELEELYQYFSTLQPDAELETDVRIFEETWRFICYVIDIMISLTSVNYFLDDPGYLAHSESSKPYMYGLMITNVTALYGLMFALQGAALPAVGATAGAIFLLIGAVKLYRQFIRPAEEMYPLINLNREVKKGFTKRHNIDETVLDTIAANLRPKTPVFVTGASGVGKTTHIYAFAEQVAAGRYPELKGKRVYYINTPVLLDSGQKSYSSNSLTDVLKHLKGKEDEVILFFDEAHSAWNEENKSLAEQFKWISDNFNVIFATTEEEYKKVQTDNSASFKAMQRRHKKIEMVSRSDEQTLAIMRQRAKELFPELPLAQETLELFLSLTKQFYPDRAQPEAALKYMEEAFSIIRAKPEADEKIKQTKAEITLLKAEIAQCPDVSLIQRLRTKENELADLLAVHQKKQE
ncbi:MAG: AAA family ATPase, partial [Chlamydiia bacterium]|nr:AAA family ATPase [Chlamydiia bacterium]